MPIDKPQLMMERSEKIRDLFASGIYADSDAFNKEQDFINKLKDVIRKSEIIDSEPVRQFKEFLVKKVVQEREKRATTRDFDQKTWEKSWWITEAFTEMVKWWQADVEAIDKLIREKEERFKQYF